MAVKQSTNKPTVKNAAKPETPSVSEAVGEVKAIDPKVLTSQPTEAPKDPVLLQSIEEGLKGKSGITVKQNIVVQGDSMVLVQAFQTAVIRGARLIGEFPQLNNFPKFIKLQVELDLSDDEWENDVPNGLHCSPVAAKDMIYEKETMDTLPWETFRKVVGKHGVQGRDRKVMLNEYLKKTEQA